MSWRSWALGALLLAALEHPSMAEREQKVCGFARHEGELLKLGNGDLRKGQVVYHRRQLAEDLKRLPADDPRLIADSEVLVRMLDGAGEAAEADALAHKAAERSRTAREAPELATALYGLGSRFYSHGDFAAAEPLLGRAATLATSPTTTLAGGQLEPTLALKAHAEALHGLKRHAEAQRQLERALELLNAKPRNDLSKAFLLRQLATVLADQGQLAKAEPALAEAESEVRRRMGSDSWQTGELMDEHAQLLRRLGKIGEAAQLEAQVRKVLEAAVRDQRLDAAARARWQGRLNALTARTRQ